jgi:hypothetical protein
VGVSVRGAARDGLQRLAQQLEALGMSSNPKLLEQIAAARRDEAHLAEEKRAAFDRDPGNLGVAHIMFQARGYHEVWCRWSRARELRVSLEKKLGAE